jgi:thiol-disulfide isomerase/thioredoxin
MALTSSVERELGSTAADFALPDAHGRIHSLDDFAAAKVLIVVFWCNHCPYVKHIKSEFAAFAREYGARGVAIVAINSNDALAYPQDAPDRMLEDAATFGYVFPYLIDAEQHVARAYDAACTPDIYVYDQDRRLAYHGQFDASRPQNEVPVDGRDLRAAVDALLADRSPSAEQTPCIGCNIKWRE